MDILQCHSKGDKRFSAFYAQIKVEGKNISIENFYQNCKKSFDGHIVKKGEIPDYIEIFSKKIPKYYLSQLYDLMWYQYFLENPTLYEYAKTFDDYCDIFKGKSINNQENTIRKCCKKGLNIVKEDCKDILSLINRNDKLPIIHEDLLNSHEDIIAHQTNCKGVMGAGLALQIKNKYPNVFYEYKNFCEKYNFSEDLLGKIYISNLENGKFIVDLFGQYGFSTKTKQTNLKYLKNSLILLKDFALNNNLSISLPFNIGCGLAGEEWKNVENILLEVFYNYPIILYKK